MPSHILPDPVPIGVCGSVTVPLARYLAHVPSQSSQAEILLDDEARLEYIGKRLTQALDRPLTSPGSEQLAALILAQFPGDGLMRAFAEKALETMRDGQMHNRSAFSPTDPRVAVLFVAWNSTHFEALSQRYGRYLSPLVATAKRFVELGSNIVGLLEIDAYVRDTPDPDEPGLPLDEVFKVDVEYSYLPGFLVGSAAKVPPRFQALMINPDLCTPEERQVLESFQDRKS